MQERALKRTVGIAGILFFAIFIAVMTWFIVGRFGMIAGDPEEIRKLAQAYGVWSFLFFIAGNILQIFIAPVPGHFLNVSAGIVFGAFRGTLISLTGVVIGGSMVMLLTRHVGKKLLSYILGDKAFRFETEVSKKGLPFLVLLSFIPSPVGDSIFYLAGITAYPLRFVMPLIFLGRVPGIVLAAVIGDNFYGVVKYHWIAGVVGILCFVILYIVAAKSIERTLGRIWEKYLPRS